jgi:hypothetical protein
MPYGGRRPADASIIPVLNGRLNEKKEIVRQLEDHLAFHEAFVNELLAGEAAMTAAMDQISAENRILRRRLGLPEAGALDLTDEEAADLEGTGAQVVDVPDEDAETSPSVEETPVSADPEPELADAGD